MNDLQHHLKAARRELEAARKHADPPERRVLSTFIQGCERLERTTPPVALDRRSREFR